MSKFHSYACRYCSLSHGVGPEYAPYAKCRHCGTFVDPNDEKRIREAEGQTSLYVYSSEGIKRIECRSIVKDNHGIHAIDNKGFKAYFPHSSIFQCVTL